MERKKEWEREQNAWWRQRVIYVPDLTLAGESAESAPLFEGGGGVHAPTGGVASLLEGSGGAHAPTGGVTALRRQLPRLREIGVGALWLPPPQQVCELVGDPGAPVAFSEAMLALLAEAAALDLKIILPLSAPSSKIDAGQQLLSELELWKHEGVAGFDMGDLSRHPLPRKALHVLCNQLRAALPEDVLLCGSVSRGGPKRAAAFVRWEDRELHLIRPLFSPGLARGYQSLFARLARWQKGLSWPLVQLKNIRSKAPQFLRALLTLALCAEGTPVLAESVFALAADEELASYAGELLAFRAESQALRFGGYRSLEGGSYICRFVRRHKQDAVGVAINLSPKRAATPILGEVLFGNSARKTADCELAGYEALILKWHTEAI